MNISSPPQYSAYAASNAAAAPVPPEDTAKQRSVPPVAGSEESKGLDERRAGADSQSNGDGRSEIVEQQRDQALISQLKARDREVRAHEAAHAAVGGQYAGAPTYTYQRGPNGVSYAVGGEVSISTSEISGDPEATLQKALQVQRAALAPAEPSAQDRKVAAQASQMAVQARIDLAELMRIEQVSGDPQDPKTPGRLIDEMV